MTQLPSSLVSSHQQPRFAPLPLKPVVRSEWPQALKQPEPISALTQSIHSKLHEKFADNRDLLEKHLGELNEDVFWSKFSSLDELGKVESKNEILKIISTFSFISKKSVFLFSNFSRKIVANCDSYSASELAAVIHAFAQLGFLEESFCLQLVNRLVADLPNTSAEELVLIADGFASTRCFHSGMVEALLAEGIRQMPNFTTSNVSLLLSSLARLNVVDEKMYGLLGQKFLQLTDIYKPIFVIPEEAEVAACTARDVTLTAYAFAKMRVPISHKFSETMVALSKILIRDFTAKELQMLVTAFDRFALCDAELMAAVSAQAQRRIAQFSCESLVNFLKAFSAQNVLDDALIARVTCQLPRLVNNAKISELVAFVDVLATAGVTSGVAVEALKPAIIAKAGQMGSHEWLTVMSGMRKIASAEAAEEVVDAFVLVNSAPANYRSTTKIINSTVMSRMNPHQLVGLVEMAAKSPQPHADLNELIMNEVERRDWSSNDASDMYCALVQLNAHENAAFERTMKNLLAKAISP